jgi:hypothetical protein
MRLVVVRQGGRASKLGTVGGEELRQPGIELVDAGDVAPRLEPAVEDRRNGQRPQQVRRLATGKRGALAALPGSDLQRDHFRQIQRETDDFLAATRVGGTKRLIAMRGCRTDLP